jgi:hypothetical protein
MRPYAIRQAGGELVPGGKMVLGWTEYGSHHAVVERVEQYAEGQAA